MSLIKANAVQIGQSPTATQNFTLAVPSSPDGTIKLARGNAGATTQDVMNVSNAGVVSFPQGLGNISNSTAIATGSTTARSLANRFADVVNVKDFGAVGDGIADDTAAIQAALNTTGVAIFFPKGRYRITSNITRTNHTYLYGETMTSSALIMEGSSFVFIGWYGGLEYNTYQLEIERLSFESPTVSSVSVIDAAWIGGVGGTSKTFIMRDCEITGTQESGGFADAVKLTNARNMVVENVRILGDRDGGLITSGNGFNIIGTTPDGGNVEIFFDKVQIYYTNVGIKINNWVEGIYITNCTFINCYTGILADSSPEVRPWISVIGSHFNVSDFAIKTIGFVQLIYTNNLIYASNHGGTATSFTGIYLDPLSAKTFALINSNQFHRFTDITATAINFVSGGPEQNESSNICNNIFAAFDIGIKLSNLTASINVHHDNIFEACTTNVLDQGVNNSLGIRLVNNNFNAFSNGCIEFGRQDGVAQSTFIDFHSSGFVNDFDARISCNGGNASDANGVIRFTSESCEFYGPAKPQIDGTTTLGTASSRWSVVYATTGTINTSDEKNKQQISFDLSPELKAWSKVEFAKFKYNDAVNKKGDNARIHFGLIAQKVKEAFESEGLDAFKYGLLCYDEWDEVEEVKDFEGNITVNHIPKGSRYGIRYDEALALECAYQRSITEKLIARIEALESK